MSTKPQWRQRPPERIRASVWLVCAALLLGGGAILMWDGGIGRQPLPDVEFPRGMTHEDMRRADVRLSPLPPLPASVEKAGEHGDDAGRGDPVMRDPFLDGLAGHAPVATVMEVNALRHSALGERVISCIPEPMLKALEELYRDTGIDLVEDLDRVAFFADGEDLGALISGHFPEGAWTQILENEVSAPARLQGDAVIHGGDGGAIAVWRDQILVIGNSEEQVRYRIDLMEGHVEAASRPVSLEHTYGEMYGAMSKEMLLDLLALVGSDLTGRVEDLLVGARFNLSAAGDVGLVGVLEATSPEAAADLSRLLAGALAVARAAAGRGGDRHLADLLELARVMPQAHESSALTLEVALPESYLDDWISQWCDDLEPLRHGEHDGPAGDVNGYH